MENSSLGGIIALLFASLTWGTTGTAASFLPADVSPLAIGASTMGIGGLLLLVTAPRLSWLVLRDPRRSERAHAGRREHVQHPR